MSQLSTVTAASVNSVAVWRSRILEQALAVFLSPFQEAVQEVTAMHERCEDMSLVHNKAVLPNGCFVFDANIKGYPVHYSVWMAFGGIRIGLKAPVEAIPTFAAHELVSRLLDGQPCQRYQLVDGLAIYDWIFKDGIASSEVMLQALTDEAIASAMAIYIGEYLTHVYLASSHLIRAFSKGQAPRGGSLAKLAGTAAPFKKMEQNKEEEGKESCSVVFSGDTDAFDFFIKNRGGDVTEYRDMSLPDAAGTAADLRINKKSSDLFAGLEYRDQDGGVFWIASITWESN